MGVGISNGGVDAYEGSLELGWVVALAHHHYSVVFARVGAGGGIHQISAKSGGSRRLDANVNAFLGAELFLGALGFPNISLQGGYGLQGAWVFEGGSRFLLAPAAGGMNLVSTGNLGFHIYI